MQLHADSESKPERFRHLQNRCTIHDSGGIRFDLVVDTATKLRRSLEDSAACENYEVCLLFRIPVCLATRDMWDKVNEIDARRDRIALGLKQHGIQDPVSYRHELDDVSLACYEINVEENSNGDPVPSSQNEPDLP